MSLKCIIGFHSWNGCKCIECGKTRDESVGPAEKVSSNSTPASPESVHFPGAKPGQARINPKDGAEMVFVPAGEFFMGSDDGLGNEKPVHIVYLDGYWIYKTPVTVGQYKKFCVETYRKLPLAPRWNWKDDHPMVNVTWNDASDYAKWAGVRLPTEAEWEKAARGTDGRKYPWGNNWDENRLQCSVRNFGDADGTAPVGSFPSGASPYGVLDMAGNVWEWVADSYDPRYYAKTPSMNPTGPAKRTRRVLRGGSWYRKHPYDFRITFRIFYAYGKRYQSNGFRCASIPP